MPIEKTKEDAIGCVTLLSICNEDNEDHLEDWRDVMLCMLLSS